MNKFYSRIYKLLAGLVRRVYRIEIVGKENEPEEGPFLVCANHISNQDVVILAASLKHQVRFLAKAELFKVPLLGRLIRALGAYPVERGRGDVGAIKNTLKLIDEGEVVGIYPQGHRYSGMHPADTEVKGGIGLILTKKRIPVLPVAIQTKKFKVCMFFKKTKVIIGKPIYVDAPGEITGKKNDYYNEISAEVFTHICGLLDKTAYPQPKNPKFLIGSGASEKLLLESADSDNSNKAETDSKAEKTAVSAVVEAESVGALETVVTGEAVGTVVEKTSETAEPVANEKTEVEETAKAEVSENTETEVTEKTEAGGEKE